MVNELPFSKNAHVDCEGCALGKMPGDEFRTSLNKRKRDILELVHTDICGPMQTRSLGGAYYYYLFVDDCKDIPGYIFPERKVILLNILKNLEVGFKSRQGRSLKFFAQIKEENKSLETLSNIAGTME